MLSLISASPSFVAPAGSSAALRTISHTQRAVQPLAADSSYDSGAGLPDEDSAEANFEEVAAQGGAVAVAEPSSPLTDGIWGMQTAQKVQGNTLRTWDISEESTKRVQLSIKSEGRPVDTNVELWHTPSYIPTKFRIYTEDGRLRPINAVIETPKHPKTVAVYNTGPIEFPFDAAVANTGLSKAKDTEIGDVAPEMVQGGKITSYTFGADVKSVQVLLQTNDLGERNMKAKIEVTQGPNQVKQFIELYASSGYKNPFYAVIETPGNDKTVRIINQNTVEFPFDAYVAPYEMSDLDLMPVIGGGFGR